MAAPHGVQVTGEMGERYDSVLTPEALELLAELHRTFDGRRLELLRAREDRYAELAAGGTLDFLAETREIREGDWQVAAARARPGRPPGRDHRAHRPQDDHQRAQLRRQGVAGRLRGRQRRRPGTTSSEGQLNLRRRPRPHDRLHLPRGQDLRARATTWPPSSCAPAAGTCRRSTSPSTASRCRRSLVDFGLYFFHSAQRLLDAGKGPYFYLPKMESHLEARLWNDVFVARAGPALGIPRGTIRATVLIETFPAAFEMEEILYELREHSAGLNAGRWDYIFSVIKKFRTRGRDFLLPDRAAGHDDGAVHARLHRAAGAHLPQARRARDRRHGGVHPEPKDPEVNEAALPEGPRRQDRARPATASTASGWRTPTWSPICQEVFDQVLGDRPNQLDRLREDVHVTAGAAARRRGRPRATSPRPACATTSASASSTSTPGCGARARSPSSTSWRTPRPPRSRARRSGSGCTTTSSSTTATSSRASWSSAWSTRRSPSSRATRRTTPRPAARSSRSPWPTSFAEFLTLPAYERMP